MVVSSVGHTGELPGGLEAGAAMGQALFLGHIQENRSAWAAERQQASSRRPWWPRPLLGSGAMGLCAPQSSRPPLLSGGGASPLRLPLPALHPRPAASSPFIHLGGSSFHLSTSREKTGKSPRKATGTPQERLTLPRSSGRPPPPEAKGHWQSGQRSSQLPLLGPREALGPSRLPFESLLRYVGTGRAPGQHLSPLRVEGGSCML